MVLAPGYGVGQWSGGVPVSMAVVTSDDEALSGLPEFPGDCEDSVLFRFENRVAKPEKVLETAVFPAAELFEGIESSVLFRLVDAGESLLAWETVEGWPPEELEPLSWAFDFAEGETEALFLLCGVTEPEVPETELSGSDWQLFWETESDDWWKSDAPSLTFEEGREGDPEALFFTITSPGDWSTIGSVDLFLYFEEDPSGNACLFHRVGVEGEWVKWDLTGLVEARPEEDENWLEGFGFRLHLSLPNEWVESLTLLNGIEFRLGSCVIPVVADGTFEGAPPLWELVYRPCAGSEETSSVDLIPIPLTEGDLDALDEEVRDILLAVFDRIHAFELVRVGCIDELSATFRFECGSLEEGEGYYLWKVEEEEDALVLTAVTTDLTGWTVFDEPLVSGDFSLCYSLQVDLSAVTFDGETIFVLAPISPEDLEPGAGPSGGEGGGGGCAVGPLTPLILLMVPLGLLFRR